MFDDDPNPDPVEMSQAELDSWLDVLVAKGEDERETRRFRRAFREYEKRG